MTRSLETSRRRGLIAAALIIPCVIVLMPVMVVAGVLYAFAASVRALARALEPSFMNWTELIEYDPVLGWKPRPLLDGHYLALGDDVFPIVTGEDGWPGARSLNDSDIVVIGDSFAFGYGVRPSQGFAQVSAPLKVKAVGAPGYSMVHGVLLMEQFGPRLGGKLVVWLPYLDNDLQDNLAPEMRGYRAPFARLGPHGWQIVGEHIRPVKWECSHLDSRRLLPKLCVPGPLADRAYSACDYLIGRAEAACARFGAQLVVLTVPHPMQLTPAGRQTLGVLSGQPDRCDADLPDRRFAESCRTHAVPLVVGKQSWSRGDYKRREGIHWNARGHRRMAEVLVGLHASYRSGTIAGLIPQPAGARRDRVLQGALSARTPAAAADSAAAGR